MIEGTECSFSVSHLCFSLSVCFILGFCSRHIVFTYQWWSWKVDITISISFFWRFILELLNATPNFWRTRSPLPTLASPSHDWTAFPQAEGRGVSDDHGSVPNTTPNRRRAAAPPSASSPRQCPASAQSPEIVNSAHPPFKAVVLMERSTPGASYPVILRHTVTFF